MKTGFATLLARKQQQERDFAGTVAIVLAAVSLHDADTVKDFLVQLAPAIWDGDSISTRNTIAAMIEAHGLDAVARRTAIQPESLGPLRRYGLFRQSARARRYAREPLELLLRHYAAIGHVTLTVAGSLKQEMALQTALTAQLVDQYHTAAPRPVPVG